MNTKRPEDYATKGQPIKGIILCTDRAVLVWQEREGQKPRAVRAWQYTEDKWCEGDGGGRFMKGLTHWRDLPDGPKGDFDCGMGE